MRIITVRYSYGIICPCWSPCEDSCLLLFLFFFTSFCVCTSILATFSVVDGHGQWMKNPENSTKMTPGPEDRPHLRPATQSTSEYRLWLLASQHLPWANGGDWQLFIPPGLHSLICMHATSPHLRLQG
ncbi:hypothetical protein I7I50_06591 [Histoplasma capsulatum G186AR]|uniref:Uncharacterized protein n=1 Tax=Ajellomyces capsulatus TaxID=5037 RepID=A0A8H7Z2E5_AJECA|nr:hypothetical protein I7I52_10337 [Histoplasma capsulatum]QSS67492.1 hypothetical protein I7I50_06591 [Histoplasma capsulatum G186AR]